MRDFTNIEKDNLLHKAVVLWFGTDDKLTGRVLDICNNSITINTPAGDTYNFNVSEIKNIEVFSGLEAKKNYESNDKMVSHPPHYQSATGLEVIDVIEAFTADLKGIEAADTANVIKYICRWKHKNGLQDLNKAMWYLTHLINHVEKTEKENE